MFLQLPHEYIRRYSTTTTAESPTRKKKKLVPHPKRIKTKYSINNMVLMVMLPMMMSKSHERKMVSLHRLYRNPLLSVGDDNSSGGSERCHVSKSWTTY